MRSLAIRIAAVTVLLCCQPFHSEALAWHDKTHLTIAEAAGLDIWYNAVAADVAKSKEPFRAIEVPNHYFSNKANKKVTAEMVMAQAARYNQPDDKEGHLYGAIIGSVREYFALARTGKYARYPLAYCAHYIGDLSMPLHNVPYDAFNKARHTINDGIIERSVRNNIGYIQRKMKPPVINSEEDLAREIAVVAESSRKLGNRMRRQKRDMTEEEAYGQVIKSAALLHAVLAWTERVDAEPAKAIAGE